MLGWFSSRSLPVAGAERHLGACPKRSLGSLNEAPRADVPQRVCEQPAGHVDFGSAAASVRRGKGWVTARAGRSSGELELLLPRRKEQGAQRENCYCGFYWAACPKRALATLASGEVTFCWPPRPPCPVPLAAPPRGTAVPGRATFPLQLAVLEEGGISLPERRQRP